ncbi:MAG: iron-only hydrogenase system regulator [Clostridiales bacterium]|jgi:putative iron-only hydrogenase system regulator|nr:iron-only hydrogenase system regulator [Clostridiales bacterium]
MENRISVVSIIAQDMERADEINALLHNYGDYIVGRMGLPYRKRGSFVICVVMDAPRDVVSSLSCKLGMLRGVAAKTTVSKQK